MDGGGEARWLKRVIASAALALAAVLVTPALAAPVVLQPTSPWNMHYAGQTCMLKRAFGQGDEQILLQFERGIPGSNFSLMMIGNAFRTKDNVAFVSLTFDPGGQPQARNVLAGKTTDAAQLPTLYFETAYLVAKPRDVAWEDHEVSAADEAKVSSLRIRQRLRPEQVLELGPMSKPMAALRKCTDEIVRLWGFDPAVQNALKSKPKPLGSPNSWLSPADFPRGGIFGGPSAVLRIRLGVDAAGHVENCTVLSQTDGPAFTEPTCDLIRKRARFAPAIDQSGKPIASFWATSVNWLN